MSDAMDKLFDGLKEILAGTGVPIRSARIRLRQYIIFLLSLKETAASAEVVKKGCRKSGAECKENLNGTAESLGDNMTGLKTEIAVFKTE